jgi:hypothetical protein
MPAGRNKPTFNGAEVDALDYAEAITVVNALAKVHNLKNPALISQLKVHKLTLLPKCIT